MKTLKLLLAAFAIVIAAAPLRAIAALPQAEVTVNAYASTDSDDDEKKTEKADREEQLYDSATDMLDDEQWSKAAATFQKVTDMRGAHADAALYWKAYALSKSGHRTEAMETLVTLQKAYPKSRWIEDGKQLELEIRRNTGQPVDAKKVESVEDEDLKLMAINSLMQTEPERAIPLLEGILSSPKASAKMKERALFVLSQSSSQKATDILVRMAKSGNPEVQSKAVRYLGIMGSERNRQILYDIYTSTGDVALKKSILKSFMVSGDRTRLLNLARNEQNPELRGDAITQLGVSGARNELAELYSSEPSIELRKKIIQAMFIGGNAEKLGEIARSERNEELRLTAIKNLGLLGGAKTGQILVSMYQSDPNPEVRKACVNGLFLQNNGAALVQLARAEKDPEMKKSIVSKLSIMHSKEATDYLLEFLRE